MDEGLRSWSWREEDHPRVVALLSSPSAAPEWCDSLETSAADVVTGKVLCVCAAAAMAREVLAAGSVPREAMANSVRALDVLWAWIDDPTHERFDEMAGYIFDDPGGPLSDSVHWAVRTATSSVGNYEAGWALGGAWSAAIRAGLTPERVNAVAFAELRARSRRGAAK